MIILFDEDEILFSGLGLGILRDAISCTVTESLNDEYTLSMEYPIDGNNFEALQLNRIIYCRPNQYSSAQPFRIYSITKPLDGKVTVEAYHISYDMNDVAVGTINGANIRDTLDQIQNGVIIDSNFKLYTDMTSTKKFKTTAPYNMRALLMGSDDSILEKYDAEIRFDKWNAYITKQRGKNRGVQVRYAKNMTDLSHELNYDRLYNGVYPYYHKETTTVTSTTTTGDFKQVYIVGKKPYQDGWLSYTSGGEAYHPVDESPVQIATEGNWYEKVYCWDSTTQRYIEKVYNQTVTLIEGVTSPDWIIIDWGSLPTITCKANADGYFKTTTDTTWTYHKSGEVIFEGTITDISSLTTNMILYYSEVIPSDSSANTDEDTSVTHVELSDKIIWLDTPEAKAMKRNRILMLDLTSEFDDDSDDDDSSDDSTSESSTDTSSDSDSSTTSTDTSDDSVPTEDELREKAEKYIKKNKIGTIKFNTSLSFIDLASTTEKDNYKDFEKIELGDTVKVVYNDLGVDIDLRVISTEYDVLKNTYENIELGEKSETLSSNSVQNGDNVSSLTNDSDYASTSTVSKLIAKTVTADYILAKNAKLTAAQITELQTARIKCTGILEASQLELDQLVAKMITAEDAAIANELSAGTVKVAGDITVNSGSISIKGGQAEFLVDRDGNLTANSVTITGGTLNINDSFEVTNDGILTAIGADIQGTIRANDGEIGGFTIGESAIYNTISSFDDESDSGVYLGIDGIKLGNNFSVNDSGVLTATGATINGTMNITSGSISIKKSDGSTSFNVTNEGVLTATGAIINGKITSIEGEIGGFTIKNDYMYNGNITSWDSTNQNGIYLGIEGIRLGGTYKITKDGIFSAGDSTTDISCGIDADGKLTAKSADILGKITATSGYIGTVSSGFVISSQAISNGYFDEPSAYDEYPMSDVVYLGTDAIRLGKDSTYNLTKSTSLIDKETAFDIELPTGTKNLSGCLVNLTFDTTSTTINLLVKHTNSSGYNSKSYNINISKGATSKTFTLSNYTDDYNILSITIPSRFTYSLKNITFYAENFNGFVVTNDGKLTASDATMNGGSISIKKSDGSTSFNVTNEGVLTATGATINGTMNITSGSISIKKSDGSTSFNVTNEGVLTATGAIINGKITSTEGTIGILTVTDKNLYSSDNSLILGLTSSTYANVPNYHLYADSIYTDKMIMGLTSSTSYEISYMYWLEFDANQGMISYYSSSNETEAIIEGKISSKEYKNIPVLSSGNLLYSDIVGNNPHILCYNISNYKINQIVNIDLSDIDGVNKVGHVFISGPALTYAWVSGDKQISYYVTSTPLGSTYNINIMIIYW